MSIEVTSVAGVGQAWFQTPAAMYVITGEDVRRSGFRSLSDALRLAPGVFVGQVNAHATSVGMRGFNGGLANKTLVLVDGRAVYDPLFSGTFWDVQDILLEDLDRIEVIRGPGATLWGANAVNGVINITTKSAKETQGFYIAGGGGTQERGFGEARYGMQLDENVWLRVWGKYFNREAFEVPGGGTAHDDWALGNGGFRLDAEGADHTTFTLQGRGYGTDQLGESVRVPVTTAPLTFNQAIADGRVSGANLLFRIKQDVPKESGWSLQAYYDRTERMQSAEFQAVRDTGDLDFRHWFHLGDRNEFMWGLGYRFTADQTEPSPSLIFDPSGRSLQTVNGFVQDTITLVPQHFFAMLGTKLEYNDRSGFEVQPGVRVWFTPNDRNTIWASVSRAVRVPSRTEEDGLVALFYNTGPTPGSIVPVGIRGNPDLSAENLIAYEAGYRVKLTDDVVFDASIYLNDYDDLISAPPGIIGAFNNDGTGRTYGTELNLRWNLAHNWRVEGVYSYAYVDVNGPVFLGDEGNTPRHQAGVRSYFDITKNVELNGALYYVDAVRNAAADPYFRLDLGVTWRLTKNLELAIWGQNLLEHAHNEFSQLEVPRGVYGMATLRF